MKPSINFFFIFLIILLPFKAASVNLDSSNSDKSLTENIYSPFSVSDVLSMNAKEFGQITGQKLTLKNRIVFGLVKGQLKRELKKGNLALDSSAKEPAAKADGSFNIGAFILGLLLGLIGFLIVILAFKDKKAWKWSLLGWGVWILLFVAFFI